MSQKSAKISTYGQASATLKHGMPNTQLYELLTTFVTPDPLGNNAPTLPSPVACHAIATTPALFLGSMHPPA